MARFKHPEQSGDNGEVHSLEYARSPLSPTSSTMVRRSSKNPFATLPADGPAIFRLRGTHAAPSGLLQIYRIEVALQQPGSKLCNIAGILCEPQSGPRRRRDRDARSL